MKKARPSTSRDTNPPGASERTRNLPYRIGHRDGHHDGASIESSPRVAIQRTQLEGAFGPAMQRRPRQQSATAPARKPSTGAQGSGKPLPSDLKSGVERLSGTDMSNVRVHYDAAEPEQLNALAFARGDEIHLGPGQEKHLPHEAWHVAQQRQGRVRATTQAKGVAMNDDPALEREADAMGEQAASTRCPQGAPSKQSPLADRGARANAPIQSQVVQRINGGGELVRTRKRKKTAAPVAAPGVSEDSDEAEGIAASGDEAEIVLDEVNIDISELERIVEQRKAEEKANKRSAEATKPEGETTVSEEMPETVEAGASDLVSTTSLSGLEAVASDDEGMQPQDKFTELHEHQAVTEEFLQSDVMPDEEKLEEIAFQIELYRGRIAALPARITDITEQLRHGAGLLASADDDIAEMEETETKVNAVSEALARPLVDVDVDESELGLEEGPQSEDADLAALEAEVEPEELPMTAGMREAYADLETALEEGAGVLEELTDRVDEYVREVAQYLEWLENERARIRPPATKEPKKRYGLKSKAKKSAAKALQLGSLLDATPTTALINKGRQVVALCKTIKHNRRLKRIAEQCKDPETRAAIGYAASQKKKKARRLGMQVGMLGPAVSIETGVRRFKKGRSEERNRQAQLLWRKAREGDSSAIEAVRDLTKRNFDEAMHREDGWKIVADKMKSK